MHNRRQRQVLVFFVCLSMSWGSADLGPYSVVEETEKKSFSRTGSWIRKIVRFIFLVYHIQKIKIVFKVVLIFVAF